MQPASSVYRACIEEAAAQGRPMLQRAIAEVERSHEQRVQRAPEQQQREAIHDAIGLLHRHGAALAERFADALLAAFAEPLANAGARTGGSLRFAELELVDDDKVQETVEVVRAEQTVAAAVEADLVLLNALVCAAQGMPTVQADRNPMRPEVYVRCLRGVVNGVPVPQAVRVRWMQFLGEALGPELVASYRSLIARLRQAGVNEAGFQIVPGASAPTVARVAAAKGAEASTLLTVRALQRLLAGDLDAPGAGAGAPARGAPETEFPGTVPAAMEALQDIRQFDAVLERLRERERGGGGSAAYREAVRREAHRPGQAIALEVVSLMVENVAGDPRLLPPVARAVRLLEPALLRLALADPRFFSSRRHPARKLLDEMTSRSLAWTSVEDPGFPAFLTPLDEAVQALVGTNVAGPEPFAFALQVLDEAWSRTQSRERRKRDKAVRALMRAEQRNLLATRIAREIGDRADVAAAPGEVAAFLRGPWAHVIAQAQLQEDDGESQAAAYRGAVPELLWSVQPHTTPAAVARLARQLPVLLETLQAGLRAVGYAPEQVQRFFDRLQELQQAAMKGQAGAPMAPEPAGELLQRLVGPAVAEQGAWLAPSEAQETGFLESVDGVGQPLFAATEAGTRDGKAAAVPALQAGSWVDLQLDGAWSRWQLAWTSPHSMLWMFTGAAGRTHTMRPALVSAMARAGTLRVVSGDHLLDQALDAVAHAAVHNSAEVRL